MEKALKPCPFCGGEAKTIVSYNECGGDKLILSAYVQCSTCGIYQQIKFDGMNKTFADYYDAFERAISLWNQREG